MFCSEIGSRTKWESFKLVCIDDGFSLKRLFKILNKNGWFDDNTRHCSNGRSPRKTQSGHANRSNRHQWWRTSRPFCTRCWRNFARNCAKKVTKQKAWKSKKNQIKGRPYRRSEWAGRAWGRIEGYFWRATASPLKRQHIFELSRIDRPQNRQNVPIRFCQHRITVAIVAS